MTNGTGLNLYQKEWMELKMEQKKYKIGLLTAIVIAIVVIIALCVIGTTMIIINKNNKKNEIKNNIANSTNTLPENKKQNNNIKEIKTELEEIKPTQGVSVVPTMLDTISSDTSWCGTFQLVWNDMKNELIKKDVEFNPQIDMAKNLNKEDFNEKMLSEDYYFKIWGIKSLALKEKIEKGIKEKFNQTSDIIEDFDWSDNGLDNPNNSYIRRYFFYTMLYRKFDYLTKFDKLEKGVFGKNYKDIEYFGINNNTKEKVGNQIDILYYNSKDDFAIVVNTKTDDEVIFCKNPKGDTFNKIYDNMNNEAKNYKGSKSFKDKDEFKAPNLKFNVKREYKEFENKPFKTANNDIAEIEKAIQTIKFSLDEKGGEIKSEAAIDMKVTSALPTPIENDEPRYFYVDDIFAIFLREKGKEKPYFAGRIEDITKFQ